jgi:hypothetical protein
MMRPECSHDPVRKPVAALAGERETFGNGTDKVAVEILP